MFYLTLKATLEGITNLLPRDEQDYFYEYSFKIRCLSCHEVHPNWVTINKHNTVDLPASRGEANLVWKCKLCKRDSSVAFKSKSFPYCLDDSGKKKKIDEFDCRGCELIEFKADNFWKSKGVESGTIFNEIDLSDGEWYDYDEKAAEQVSITEIEWDITRSA